MNEDLGKITITMDFAKGKLLEEASECLLASLEQPMDNLSAMIGRYQAEMFMLDVVYRVLSLCTVNKSGGAEETNVSR